MSDIPIVTDTNDPRKVVRPHFGERQVRSLKGLHRKGVYWLCSKVARHRKAEALTNPYKQEDGWAMEFRIEMSPGEWFTETIPLADWGVVAYPDGHWSRSNWIERR